MKWREFFYFPKSDRRILILFSGVLLGLLIAYLISLFASRTEHIPSSDEELKAYQAFLKSLRADSAKQNAEPYYDVPEQTYHLFPFDPNTADSTDFLRLGLQPWQVKSIYKYRARGGRYHTVEDFARLYGMTGEVFERLKPYIRIAEKFRYLSDTFRRIPLAKDTLLHSSKYAEGTVLNLNLADTSELKKIPGIGSGYARMIVNYRDELGGFVCISQLEEIEMLPLGFEKWFMIKGEVQKKLEMNKLSLKRLMRHPYLNFYQSRVIVDHRRKYGPLTDLRDLELYEEFTTADFARLRPYVDFSF